jgi:hypothetical protein
MVVYTFTLPTMVVYTSTPPKRLNRELAQHDFCLGWLEQI